MTTVRIVAVDKLPGKPLYSATVDACDAHAIKRDLRLTSGLCWWTILDDPYDDLSFLLYGSTDLTPGVYAIAYA